MSDTQRNLASGADAATEPAPELDLDAIEARADTATEGPWWAWDRGVGWHIAIGPEVRDQFGRPEHLLPEGNRTDIGRAADAEFIAHARNDVPALVAEVRRLRRLASPAAVRVMEAALRWREAGSASTGLVGPYNRAVEGLARAVDASAGQAPNVPSVFALPDEPGPEVTELWDRHGKRWERAGDGYWTNERGGRWLWGELVSRRGPLSTTPPTGTETDHG